MTQRNQCKIIHFIAVITERIIVQETNIILYIILNTSQHGKGKKNNTLEIILIKTKQQQKNTLCNPHNSGRMIQSGICRNIQGAGVCNVYNPRTDRLPS